MDTKPREAKESVGTSPPSKGGVRLVLASEALKDDLAPFRPGATTGRIVLCLAGISLGLLGLALRQGLGATGAAHASIAFSAGGMAAAMGLLPFPYALRAAIGLGLGVALMGLGARSLGPLAALASGIDPLGEIDRLITLTVLPAALMFRARYRAYLPARAVLVAALALSAPFVIGEVLHIANSNAHWLVRGAVVLELLAISCSFFGFMGTDTTGAGFVWAALVIGGGGANLALGDIVAADPERWAHSAAAVGTICAAITASFGAYQLLAAALARDARRASTKKEPARPETSPA